MLFYKMCGGVVEGGFMPGGYVTKGDISLSVTSSYIEGWGWRQNDNFFRLHTF